jgi:hypothetical protein
MVTIDGTAYNIGIKSLKRKADFLDKYADRTEDGALNRELIGVYYNYELAFSPTLDATEYSALWDKLTEPEEFHTVIVPSDTGDYSFTAYMSNVTDELLKKDNTNTYWQSLTANFIAKIPART